MTEAPALDRPVGKYKSGWCGIGCHEGLKPKSPSGQPMKVCTAWQLCTCKCHVEITEMYEMAGLPRDIHDNPEYSPPLLKFVMPVFGVDYGLDRSAALYAPLDGTDTLQRTGTDAPGHRSFAPTPSGRAARGQLEDQVLEVCTEWAIDRMEVCTPAFVAWDIARYHKVPEPSTGAISAVFDRWAKYGFAVIDAKPVRFSGFTEEGQQKGLAAMRAIYKHNKRRDG